MPGQFSFGSTKPCLDLLFCFCAPSPQPLFKLFQVGRLDEHKDSSDLLGLLSDLSGTLDINVQDAALARCSNVLYSPD